MPRLFPAHDVAAIDLFRAAIGLFNAERAERIQSASNSGNLANAVVNLNLKGLFFTAQAVGRYWIENRRFAPEHKRGMGKIINIGSIAGLSGFRRRAPYTSSKSGVVGLTRTLALEWAADGICVNCLAPGYVETDLTKALFEDPAFLEVLRTRISIGRRGYPLDMVGPAIFLAAPASDYITGQTLIVDGGYLAG